MANLRRQTGSDDDVQEIAPMRMSGGRKRKAPTEAVKIEDEEEESSSEDDNHERGRSVPAKRGKKVSRSPNKGSGRLKGKKAKA